MFTFVKRSHGSIAGSVFRSKVSPMLRGKVKFFNKKNKFGFITDDRGTDYYVHAREVENHTLEEGDVVDFEVRSVKRGLEAYEVKKIEP